MGSVELATGGHLMDEEECAAGSLGGRCDIAVGRGGTKLPLVAIEVEVGCTWFRIPGRTGRPDQKLLFSENGSLPIFMAMRVKKLNI